VGDRCVADILIVVVDPLFPLRSCYVGLFDELRLVDSLIGCSSLWTLWSGLSPLLDDCCSIEPVGIVMNTLFEVVIDLLLWCYS